MSEGLARRIALEEDLRRKREAEKQRERDGIQKERAETARARAETKRALENRRKH